MDEKEMSSIGETRRPSTRKTTRKSSASRLINNGVSNNTMKGTTIISIISGKGGTGKSLFTAVLGNCLAKEHCKVLLVDMDIHVRGLTILLSKYIGGEKGMSVTDCLKKELYDNNFATYRFQECEILPAVSDIGQPLSEGIKNEAIEIFLEKLYSFAQYKYDVVLLDCRSGLDDSLVKIVKSSDFVISVSEDDDVCLHSNMNLINYFRYRENINNIYTVINKGRRINNKADIKRKLDDNFNFSFNCIGVIPFDETIMEDYGKDRFWLTVYDTLYFYGIVKFWNNFRDKTPVSCFISEDKYSFGESKISRNNMSWIFRLYGFAAVIAGTFFPLISELMNSYTRISIVLSSTISLMGLLMLVFSSRKFRSFLLGKDDEPEKKYK